MTNFMRQIYSLITLGFILGVSFDPLHAAYRRSDKELLILEKVTSDSGEDFKPVDSSEGQPTPRKLQEAHEQALQTLSEASNLEVVTTGIREFNQTQENVLKNIDALHESKKSTVSDHLNDAQIKMKTQEIEVARLEAHVKQITQDIDHVKKAKEQVQKNTPDYKKILSAFAKEISAQKKRLSNTEKALSKARKSIKK